MNRSLTNPTFLILTLAGWFAAVALALSAGAPADDNNSSPSGAPAVPVKAYPG